MTSMDRVRESRLFGECEESDLAPLAGIARSRDYADGEKVFSHGDEARELMVVAAGRIQLELPLSILGESKNIPFEVKQRGEVVGWSALVSPFRFTLSGRASGGASVIAFTRSDLVSLFEANPRLGYCVMRNLASITSERLHHTQLMWAREVQRNLDERYR